MSTSSGRTALVVGATGLVGGYVVACLARRPEWTRIVVLARRPVDTAGGRVEHRVVDFEALGPADLDGADDVFACLGTTIKKAGSEEAFRKVDHDYTVRVAELAKAAGATRFALVSSVGAATDASSFYLRVKGETERDVGAIGFPSLVVAHPSFLVGERAESRPGEKVGIAVTRALSFAMVGGLKKYRPIAARHVAEALVAAVLEGTPGTRVLEHDELVALSLPAAAAQAAV